MGPDNLTRGERPAVEIPTSVSVNGYLGSQWKGPITGQRLMWLEGLQPSYDMLRRVSSCYSHIALRMSNGDIQILFAANPYEEDNTRRGYFLTSVFMNKAKRPGEELLAIEVSYETTKQLSFEIGKPLVIDGLTSDGVITEIVTYDKTRELDPDILTKIPAHTIAADFTDEVIAG